MRVQSLGRLRAPSTQLRAAAVLVSCWVNRRARGSDESSGIGGTARAGIGFQLCQVLVHQNFVLYAVRLQQYVRNIWSIHVCGLRLFVLVESAVHAWARVVAIACCSYVSHLPTDRDSLSTLGRHHSVDVCSYLDSVLQAANDTKRRQSRCSTTPHVFF